LRQMPEGAGGMGGAGVDGYKWSAVYVLEAGKPKRVMVLTGITDGSYTEVRTDKLTPGDKLIVGSETTAARNTGLQPPPGMGGGGFRGPGRGGR
ncbi:MAG TPA: efflux RND transporter periplasmic adaptor subunit, partial [Candidatus Eisenbacteria bacterium]|nr:efflux RND transporter periplasmic adaptor subunit [Candidatus Eisenbacteria bacterium]